MLEELYLENSHIPKRYLQDVQLQPSTDDVNVFNELRDIQLNIKDFVNKGKNLYICSRNVGNGKTSWATKIMKAYIKEVQNCGFKNDTPALFINVNNFLNEKKLAIGDRELASKVSQIEKAILTAKLVVFDDIADKSLSEYDMSTMYYWIEYRTSNSLSCIYTANELPSQLKETLSGKLYSRIINYSEQKMIKAGDCRKC